MLDFLSVKSLNLRWKTIIAEDRVPFEYQYTRLIIKHHPRCLVFTRLGKPAAVLFKKDSMFRSGLPTWRPVMKLPRSLYEAWEFSGYGNFEPYVEMVNSSIINLHFDFGNDVPQMILVAYDEAFEFDDKDCFRITGKEDLKFRYQIERPFFKEIYGRKLDYEEFVRLASIGEVFSF